MKGWFAITLVGYIMASVFPVMEIRWHSKAPKYALLISGAIALCAHAVLLYHWIDFVDGQNLNFLNLLSFSLWLIGLLAFLLALLQPVGLLLSLTSPLAVISVIVIFLFPPRYHIVNMTHSFGVLMHILLSILTLGILCVAGLLAVLLGLQERLLRFHRVTGVAERLPPLQAMEVVLFQVVAFGFALLTTVLITSIYCYFALLWQHFWLLQKALLVLLAWLVLLILLVGRCWYGWRGRRAIYYTLTGMLLLLAAYCFSQLMLETLFK